MEKYDKFFLDKCPCSKTSMLVFEQGYLSRKTLSYFSIYTAKENLSRKTCQRKLASVNEALLSEIERQLVKRCMFFILRCYLPYIPVYKPRIFGSENRGSAYTTRTNF